MNFEFMISYIFLYPWKLFEFIWSLIASYFFSDIWVLFGQLDLFILQWEEVPALQKNTLPWWYVFVTVGRVFCHACTSMTNLWQNQDSHSCAVVEVFHDITKIIITKVSTSMTINRTPQKCFRQGWPTGGIHHNRTSLSYRVPFWIR